MLDATDEHKYYDQLHAEKYRDQGQTRLEHCNLFAERLAFNENHREAIYDVTSDFRFLAAGRVQAAMGATEREVSPFNCSVSQTIQDSMDSIMEGVHKAAMILRLGTGIGFNFSRLRPYKSLIAKLKSESSGPLSFMKIYDVMGSTIASAGHRRGAMMGIMNVDHPDIELFIDAKMEPGAYRQFNFSVGVTDKFMKAVKEDSDWELQFNGQIYKVISARYLWDKILHNAYMSAEPGVIFIDRLNQNNNLYYCEDIEATNPCAEQPLPPNGLCLLGSFNLVKYIQPETGLDINQLRKDVYTAVGAYDNVFDKSIYAVPEHKKEALNKRRMGLGFLGVANAIEYYLGKPSYGSDQFCEALEMACQVLTHSAYRASIDLAKLHGPFPMFDRDMYCQSKFVRTLPEDIQEDIYKYGIRNSHLISYAPCGTIAQCAGNVSSGIEPIFYHSVTRKVHMKDGLRDVTLTDYNYRNYDFKGKTLEDCSVQDHLNVAEVVQKYTDSAISKTVNAPPDCTYREYANIYMKAFDTGLKGITVFCPNESTKQIRGMVITKSEEKLKEEKPIEQAYNCPNGVCAL